MICIFTPGPSARHQYIFSLIFERRLCSPFRIIQNEEDFINADGIKICYHEQRLTESGIFIKSSGLLSEKKIHPRIPGLLEEDSFTCIFPVNEQHADLPFDIFSAAFWMLSRYEEYLDFEPDKHGRFEVSASFAFRHGFHRRPIVDQWIQLLVQTIQAKYPQFSPSLPRYEFQPTYDIDQAWAHLHKSKLKTGLITIRDMLTFNTDKNRQRWAVLRGKMHDPYDSFQYQFELHKRFGLHPMYFFHPGTYGRFDKNISIEHPAFGGLLRQIQSHSAIGIHPSYRAADDANLLRKEIQLLSQIAESPVTKCRQHYLRIRIPYTYRNYISCGITDDYSLGWASDIGFRAGTSRSFIFYDLGREAETLLTIHPLTAMDGALKDYLKLSPVEANTILKSIIGETRKSGGTYISLWHNISLGSSPEWAGWNEVYEQMIREALPELNKE